jgi:cell division protein FtsB
MKTVSVFLALLMSAVSLHAAGAVHGRVLGLDEKGNYLGIIAGAKIELQNDAGAVVASTTSSYTGFYAINGLSAAPYRYTVKAAGYRDEAHERGFALPAGETDHVHDFLLTREGKAGASQPAMALQSGRPAVHGRVYGQDWQGRLIGPVAGAQVELLSGGRVAATATASAPGGYYEIKSLPLNEYTYRVTADGYKPEDEQRGFSVPKDALEYVQDFLLTQPPPKTGRCDLPVLVVKKFPTTKDEFVRMPMANAHIVLLPVQASAPSPTRPIPTDAKGEAVIPDVPEGEYGVAIDAPECEPFTGTLKVTCDMQQVVFELSPCNEILHSYVRAMLRDGWGPTPACQAAAEKNCKLALRNDDKSCEVDLAMALCELSSGDHDSAQQWLAKAIGKKSASKSWDRACETRLWLNLLHHNAQATMQELRSMVLNHYRDRPCTEAAKDTAAVCGIALGMLKGPWKDGTTSTSIALLETELMNAFGDGLRPSCEQGREAVAVEFGKLRSAFDAAKNRLVADATQKRNAEVAKMQARQQAIQTEVAVLDPEIQQLTATVAEFDRNFRVQAAGFMGLQQQAAAQMPALKARLLQVQQCMLQDQANLSNQATMQSSMLEIRQHQVEIQQITAQMNALHAQEQQAAMQIANLQNQMGAGAAQARAQLETKSLQRNTLAAEFDRLEAARTAPFDPTKLTTPELDDLARRQNAVKTYRDLPLETRREELMNDMDCGAAKEPRLAISQPIEIMAPAPPRTAVPGTVTPVKALPVAPSAPPPANLGDAAEIVLNNTLPQEIRVFTLPAGAENEQLARQLKPGEEALVPARIGQTFIVRDLRGGEIQRHRVAKKIDRLRLVQR